MTYYSTRRHYSRHSPVQQIKRNKTGLELKKVHLRCLANRQIRVHYVTFSRTKKAFACRHKGHTLISTFARLTAVLSAAFLISAALLDTPGQAAPTASKAASYIPGVSLVPDVFQPDGVTPRTYNTAQGPSLWTPGLPVLQGDKIKLNVFAATGGVELRVIIVRLDNVKIADVSAAPWNTVLDSARLAPGSHMVEVWAQSGGDRPQAVTKTLSFYVARQLDAKYLVQGTQQLLSNGTVATLPLDAPGQISLLAPDAAPEPPAFLKGQTADSEAQIAVYARSAASVAPLATSGVPVTGIAVTINEPTLFAVQPTLGSTATRYAYAIVRDGQVSSVSEQPLDFQSQMVRIQRYANGQGLHPGTLTLWFWGIDTAGRPSAPVKAQIQIPG